MVKTRITVFQCSLDKAIYSTSFQEMICAEVFLGTGVVLVLLQDFGKLEMVFWCFIFSPFLCLFQEVDQKKAVK